MTTETELVLMTLTAEELDDANRWVSLMNDSWRTASARVQSQTGFATDGPWHLLTAMRLAILRERVTRHGAEPWYIGMPTADHVAGRLLELYQQRLVLNADHRFSPRLSAAGVIDQGCVVCGERKPLTIGFWARPDGLWADTCLACWGRVDHDRLFPIEADVPSSRAP